LGENMDKNIYLIGGIICLIIGIAYALISKKISAGVVALFILFILGLIKGLGLR